MNVLQIKSACYFNSLLFVTADLRKPLVPAMLHLCQITFLKQVAQFTETRVKAKRGDHRGYGVFRWFRGTTPDWHSFGACRMVHFLFFNLIYTCVSKHWTTLTEISVGQWVDTLSSLRMGTAPEKRSDSASEQSDDASSVDVLWQPDRLCRETDLTSGAQSDTRRLARRKLFIACAISFVFMTGEVIGKTNNHHFPQIFKILKMVESWNIHFICFFFGEPDS